MQGQEIIKGEVYTNVKISSLQKKNMMAGRARIEGFSNIGEFLESLFDEKFKNGGKTDENNQKNV